LWPLQHPISNGIALLCGAIGALSIVRAFRIERDTAAAFSRSSHNDARAASPDLESIQGTGPSIQQLFSQGERCISYLGDSDGAQLFAKSVCGLVECVEQLGAHSPEAARLIARIDGELTNRYTNLPALKELAQFSLSNAWSLAATLEEPQTRAAFARSLCTLAREGGCETNVEMQATAAILYSFARDLAPANQHMRIELLESAHRMTGAYDGIRENIESQLREIGECRTCSGAASDSDAVRARTIMKRLKVSSSPS